MCSPHISQSYVCLLIYIAQGDMGENGDIGMTGDMGVKGEKGENVSQPTCTYPIVYISEVPLYVLCTFSQHCYE